MPAKGFDMVLVKGLRESWLSHNLRGIQANTARCWDDWGLGDERFAVLSLERDVDLAPESKLMLGGCLMVAYPPRSRQSSRGLVIWKNAVRTLLREANPNTSVRFHGVKLQGHLINIDSSRDRFDQVLDSIRAGFSPVDTELEALRREADAKFSGRAPCAVIDLASRRRR